MAKRLTPARILTHLRDLLGDDVADHAIPATTPAKAALDTIRAETPLFAAALTDHAREHTS